MVVLLFFYSCSNGLLMLFVKEGCFYCCFVCFNNMCYLKHTIFISLICFMICVAVAAGVAAVVAVRYHHLTNSPRVILSTCCASLPILRD